MAAAVILIFTLWSPTLITTAFSCPDLCSCSNKYGRHVAECSYRGLTEVPEGLPSNVTTVSLSANKISSIPRGTFDTLTQVASLWMAHNKVVSIQRGALVSLSYLRNLDVSHNKIADFPWDDLKDLTALHLLKLNHNRMSHLPRDAFSNLRELRSLRLNNNKFVTIAHGTFDRLVSLSYLQVHHNPFFCTCSLDWLRGWISTTSVSIPDQDLIICASPEKLNGQRFMTLPKFKCMHPNVTIRSEPDVHTSLLYEDTALILTCEFVGNPIPRVAWNIRSKSLDQELALSMTKDDSADSNEFSVLSHRRFLVFDNGTLIIPNLRREDGGRYTCSATNGIGRAEDSVSLQVLPSLKLKPTTPTLPETQTASTLDSEQGFMNMFPSAPPAAEDHSKSNEEETRYPSRASKCGLTANTRFISGRVLNGSENDIIQYTSDFGVIALVVSETEVTVTVNPLFMHGQRSEESRDLPDVSDPERSGGLYLCVTSDRRHSSPRWSRIQDGIKTYTFKDLRHNTNYTLCLIYRGKDCEVQVLFTTRRRVTNLLIIISVSVCLLTVSTVPLLGATCYHLVYKYRSKTFKLILKAKDQCHVERRLAAKFSVRAPHAESQRTIDMSQLDDEEEEKESKDGDKEADTEESVVTESLTPSQCREHVEDCEVGSESSDRLPLGAEADNIAGSYE